MHAPQPNIEARGLTEDGIRAAENSWMRRVFTSDDRGEGLDASGKRVWTGR
jgi:hypothetical protein